jgi:FMN phosphatase YigB (HAD superfamily)
MPLLKAVLFDIGDTLYDDAAFARTARRNVQAMVRTGIRLEEKRSRTSSTR